MAHAEVTINDLMPGVLDPDRYRASAAANAKALGVSDGEMAERRRSSVPAGRGGDPAEFGDAYAFLCSALAGYITARICS